MPTRANEKKRSKKEELCNGPTSLILLGSPRKPSKGPERVHLLAREFAVLGHYFFLRKSKICNSRPTPKLYASHGKIDNLIMANSARLCENLTGLALVTDRRGKGGSSSGFTVGFYSFSPPSPSSPTPTLPLPPVPQTRALKSPSPW
jgi:hypothetical protein